MSTSNLSNDKQRDVIYDLLLRAKDEMDQGRWEDGHFLLEKVNQLNVKVVHYYLMMTQYHVHHCDAIKARYFLLGAKKPDCIYCDSDTPVELSNLEKQVVLLEQVANEVGGSDILRNRLKAKKLFEEKKYAEAVLCLKELLSSAQGEVKKQIQEDMGACLFLSANEQLALLMPSLVAEKDKTKTIPPDDWRFKKLIADFAECCQLCPENQRFAKAKSDFNLFYQRYKMNALFSGLDVSGKNKMRLNNFRDSPHRDQGMISG